MPAFIALDHERTEDPGLASQGHTQPIQGKGAKGLHLALGLQLQQGCLIHQQRIPTPEDILCEAPAQAARLGSWVGLIHPVGKGDRVLVPVPEGEVEVLGRHQVPHDAVDFCEEFRGVPGLDGGLGDAVGGLLGLLCVLALGDVLGDGDDDLLAEVRPRVETEFLGKDLAILPQAPELHLLGLALEGLAETLGQQPKIVLAGGGQNLWGLADEKGPWIPVHPRGALVHIQEAAFRVLDVDRF